MVQWLQTEVPAAYVAGALTLALVSVGLLLRERRRTRRAEQEAQTVRAELDAMAANMREAVIAYDMDRRLIYINPAFEQLTGYSAEELRELEFLHYIHPDDRVAILPEWDRLSHGGLLCDQEYRVRTRAGQIRWASAAWHPIRDREGRQIGHLGTEVDITERKLAEAERLHDAELFQAVLDIQQAVAATGLDSHAVMHLIAERSQRLTGASGVILETASRNAPAPRLHLGVVDASASVLTVELADNQQTLGVLKIVSKTPHAFTDRHTKALRVLGGLAGAALGHAAAYEGRQHRLEERTQSLHDSEQRFKQLVDVAQEGIWVTDNHGIITYANPRMADMLGQQNGTLLGRQVSDFIDPSSRPHALRLLSEGIRGPTERRELRLRRTDGSTLWALASASPVSRQDGTVVGTVGLLTDITDHKQVEESLRRSTERLSALRDMDQAILTATSPDEVGHAALARLRRLVPCHYCTAVLFDAEGRGGRLLAGFAGTAPLSTDTLPPQALAPSGRDASHRRDALRYIDDLHAMDEPPPLLRQLRDDGFRSALTVPLLVDSAPIGEITLASTAPEAFAAEHRDAVLEVAVPLAIAIQHARLREELADRTADLERRLAERGAALRGASTELEIILHAVAHDFRPPLRHIDGFARLLLDEAAASNDPTFRHYAGRIREGTTRMAALVDDLVRLSRVARQDLMRRPVDLGVLVEEIVGHLQCGTDGRSVRWEIEPLPTVDADPQLVRLAITELLTNALKFTAPREHAVIHVKAVQRDDQPGLAVQDNGVGFRMTHAGKLFGAFQRLHRAGEFDGNGAGLALVQRIAQRHGGQVWAEAEEDIGATFFLTFGSRTVLT